MRETRQPQGTFANVFGNAIDGNENIQIDGVRKYKVKLLSSDVCLSKVDVHLHF